MGDQPNDDLRSTPPFTILQQNCQRRYATSHTLFNERGTIDNGTVDFSLCSLLCLQEPYTIPQTRLPHSSHSAWTLHLPTVPLTGQTRPRACTYTNRKLLPDHLISPIPCNSPDITALSISRAQPLPPITVINVYNPPTAFTSLPPLRALLDSLPVDHESPLFLLGDFNLHDPLWNPTGYDRSDPQADDLLDALFGHDLTLISQPGVPTFTGGVGTETTIDLVFANAAAREVAAECITDNQDKIGLLADHRAIITTVSASLPEVSAQTRGYAWSKADWEVANGSLATRLAAFAVPAHDPDLIDSAAEELTQAIIAACDTGVPRANPCPHSKRWWSDHLKPLRSDANRARRAWKHARTPEAHRQWQQCLFAYDQAVLRQKTLHWVRFLTELDSKDLYRAARVVKFGRDPHRNIFPIDRPDGTSASTAEEIAETLHTSLATPFAEYDNSDIPTLVFPPPAPDFVLRPEALDAAVAKIPPDKAPGIDGIKGIALKNLWPSLRQPLNTLLQASLSSGHYPTPWKTALTTVLRKPNKESYHKANAYRPIALLPTIAKLFDIVLADAVSIHLEQDNRLPFSMFGGRQARSTTDALLYLTESINAGWASKKASAVLSLDAQAAFPSVRHDRLVAEAKRLGLPANLVVIIDSYLFARYAIYVINGFRSVAKLLTQGMPQGSSLSGPLSNIYFASLHEEIRVEPRILPISFADDFNLLVTGLILAHLRTILERIYPAIVAWGARHGIRFAPQKSVYLPFPRPRTPADVSPLLIGDEPLPPSTNSRILGVFIDSTLTFKDHKRHVIAAGKAATMVASGMVKVNSGIKLPLMRRLYVTTVCAKTDYAAIVWHKAGQHGAVISGLQTVQNLAARQMLGAFRTTSHLALAFDANLPSPSERLDRVVFRAAARLLTLPESHPMYHLAHRARDHRRQSYKGTLQVALHSPRIQFPHRTELQSIPLLTLPMGYVSPFIVLIAASADQAVADHDRFMTDLSPATIVYYTDGSKGDDGVGAAAIRYSRDPAVVPAPLHCHLGPAEDHSVHEAELMAIFMAVSDSPNGADVHLFADPQASLKSLLGRPPKSPHLAMLLRLHFAAFSKPRSRFTLHWIPGHEGIPGNELADEHAKLAAAIPVCTDERFPPPLLTRATITSRIKALPPPPESLARARPHRAIRDGIPAHAILTALSQLPREICSIVVQLRSGHVALRDYLHWRHHRGNPNCLKCRQRETVKHYIMECRRFVQPRLKLRKTLAKLRIDFSLASVLSQPKSLPALAEFIVETRRFPLARTPNFDRLLPPTQG